MPPSLSAEPPYLLIVAGPNGSGKSSAYQDADIESFGRSVWIINPDLLAARIRDIEGMDLLAANLQSVQRIEIWLEASIKAHQTIGVETVLSTPKYRRLVEMAKGLGFQVRLIYVVLDNPRRNVERVRLRVKKGGHAVPEDRILERYTKSLQQMPWFLEQADEAWFYDNSGAQPRLVGKKQDGVVTLDPSIPPDLKRAIQTIETN
ncbi:putative ABC-type ATPase [Caulobacter ginsengisoli]|uniref:ABC-type ATPase n=1 Tax=Caulobacter ginsengisoli TaxID=400775 RepID=A0ABU0IJU8_9CAUL|nr:zeta toxin family protein [Caulobacter ginsengisoli]MDQ0462275.1 putative ABC-type ATPase [Caulobacter ginsengisoli]